MMKPVLNAVCCGLLCLVATAAVAQTGTWAKQKPGTMTRLHSVYFINQNRGWAAGGKGTVLSTEDGGKTWRVISTSFDDVVRDVFFSDEQNGWLVCEANPYRLKTKEDPRAYLMRTTDGGNKWTRVEVARAELKGATEQQHVASVDAVLVRAVFSPGGHGWTFGEAGAIFATRDAGETWIRLPSPTRHLLLGGAFVDDDRGWVVGAGATIVQTSDGGETWYQSTLANIDKSIRFTATTFVDNRTGWVVGSAGTVYCTTNGGRTWQKQESGVDVDLFDVKFVDAQEGWAVGAEGTIIHTADGGGHWTTERSGTPHPLERVFFTDKAHGWAVGFGGTVVAYSKL